MFYIRKLLTRLFIGDMISVVSEKFSGLTVPTVGSAYKEKVMHQIMKIVGVSAEKIGALHKAVKEARADGEVWVNSDQSSSLLSDRAEAEIIKSELDNKNWPKLYTVTISVSMKISGYIKDPESKDGNLRAEKDGRSAQVFTLYPSIKMIRKIYNALGVFPDEEKLVESAED